ncbi:hypothetical protein B0H11DRAFT_1940164 [Mycena galericulata]|nr:hypothetical protein B0H11DRAFT_1940164 [Mycena galericulata]
MANSSVGNMWDFPDALDFRSTRSGRAFSPWTGTTIESPVFEIATAVIAALDSQADEDLAQPDSGHPGSLNDLDGSFTSPLESDSTQDPIQVPLSGSSTSKRCPSRVTRDKEWSKIRRAKQRTAMKTRAHIDLLPPQRRPHHVKKSQAPIKTRVAATGWIGLRDNGQASAEQDADFRESGWHPSHTLEAFFGAGRLFNGFRLVKYIDHHSRPIVDSQGKVFGLFGGHPNDPNWMRDVHDPAVAAMDKARMECSISDPDTYHRRGNWPGLTGGQSHGGGQVKPGTLVNGVINAAVLACLFSNLAFMRLAGFATGLFANWAPRLFDYYVIYMRRFYGRNSHLKRPFLNGIWSAVTFNLGPRTCSIGHRDFANLAFGWCAITALGDFDYTKGGHLILWDCKLILEFPPGSTILIPSAAIFHSNIPIATGERRYSFTQYTAGGLFRWVEHGFQSEEAYFASLTPEEQRSEREAGRERWSNGGDLFSTLAELQSDI